MGVLGQLSEASIAACADARIDCIEAHLWGPWLEASSGDPAARCKALAAEAARRGVKLWSAHLPFGSEWDISVSREEDRKRMAEANAALLPLAAALGARMVVVHGSYEPIPAEERRARLASCRSSLAELSARSRELGMQLALECLPRTCLAHDTEETLRLTESVEGLAVCFDTNHLLTDKAEHFIAGLGSRIVTLHVSDYDRIDEKHWLPGRGVNDWNVIIGALERVGYGGPWMFEVSRGSDANSVTPADLRACWDALLHAFRGSNAPTGR
jgi:sugar phosphate isomerase/epimerase